MIRPARPTDTPAVVGLAVDAGLFSQDDAVVVHALMDDFFARCRAEGHACLLDVDGDATPVGVAYYQPAPATDRTWELLMIAVRPDRQGQGRGGALLRDVEDELRDRQQRLLLVATSGMPGSGPARAFYEKAGYSREARVRDYYATGDDMVMYRRDLLADRDR